MNYRRPVGVTAVCALAMCGAVIEMLTGFVDFREIGVSDWVRDHAKSANLQLVLHYAQPGITLLACYFMLDAKNWARWLYVVSNGLRYGTALALLASDQLAEGYVFLRFKGVMVPGILLLLIAVVVLFREDARGFFAAGGRRSWQRDEEE